jgi:hypothetical protein
MSSSQVTVKQLKDAIANCTNLVKQYAVLPTQYYNKLIEDDVREFNCIRVLQSIVDGTFALVINKKDALYIPSQFYMTYSVEAARYALAFLNEMYDDEDGYGDEPDPELLRMLRGDAPTNRIVLN